MYSIRVGLLLLSFLPAFAATQKLNINQDEITVSGMSSGAQMAHQLHIAYADIFSGAGLIAGGPFACAEGSLAMAMSWCLGKVSAEFSVEKFIQEIKAADSAGKIAAVEFLKDDSVWVFHGQLDKATAVELSDAIVTLYSDFIPVENIRYIKDVEAAHNFPTLANGSDCRSSSAPYIGNCAYDAAGELLQHLYPELKKPVTEFEPVLSKVKLSGGQAAGLSDTAFMFIPTACNTGELACKAHLALHGCAQSATQIGTTYIMQSGYLRWAEANNIVLAFPQVAASPSNPLACWDWWGYTGADYRWRNAAQMKLLAEWMQQLEMPKAAK